MKRFITIVTKQGEEIWIEFRNAAAVSAGGALGVDGYQWLKKKIKEKGLSHNDQNAQHHNDLPHQGGYVSFYIDERGAWNKVNH